MGEHKNKLIKTGESKIEVVNESVFADNIKDCPACSPGCCVPTAAEGHPGVTVERACGYPKLGYGSDTSGLGKVSGYASEERMKQFKERVERAHEDAAKLEEMPNSHDNIMASLSVYDQNIFFNVLSDATTVGKKIKVAHSFKRFFNKFKAFYRGMILFPKMLIALGEEFNRIKNANTVSSNVIKPEELQPQEDKNAKQV